MRKGTTPVHAFTLPFDTAEVKSVRIVYEQNDRVILTKETADIEMQDNILLVRLSQEDTLQFECNTQAKVQVRTVGNSGTAMASTPICFFVYECLDNEVLI